MCDSVPRNSPTLRAAWRAVRHYPTTGANPAYRQATAKFIQNRDPVFRRLIRGRFGFFSRLTDLRRGFQGLGQAIPFASMPAAIKSLATSAMLTRFSLAILSIADLVWQSTLVTRVSLKFTCPIFVHLGIMPRLIIHRIINNQRCIKSFAPI